jgi:hypothetical protein
MLIEFEMLMAFDLIRKQLQVVIVEKDYLMYLLLML